MKLNRRHFIEGGLFVSTAAMAGSTTILADHVLDSDLADEIYHILLDHYPILRDRDQAVYEFAKQIQKADRPTLLKLRHLGEEPYQRYLLIQFAVRTNFIAFSEGKASQVSLMSTN